MKESNATQDPSMSLKPTVTHIHEHDKVIFKTKVCRHRNPDKIVGDIDKYITERELSSQLKHNLTNANAWYDPLNGDIHLTVGFETTDAFQSPRGPRALKHSSEIVKAVKDATAGYDSMRRAERLQRRNVGVDSGTNNGDFLPIPYSPLETQAFLNTGKAVHDQIYMLFEEADLFSISLRN